MRLVLIGLGNVGQGFLELLQSQADKLAQVGNFRPQVVGVSTRSGGTLYHPNGLNLATLLAYAGNLRAYPEASGLVRGQDALQLIHTAQADVLVEVSPSNFETAQPATAYIRAALKAGWHVVTANKGPIALHYTELAALAQANKRQLRFEGTVMAGTPSILLAREGLAGSTITRVRGILNGTTNYILTQMEQGLGYAEALGQAQALGYAEADPRGDVDGWDAAGKLLIVAATLMNRPLKMSDLQVSGISHLTPHDIESARSAGERYKLIASLDESGGRVEAVRLPLTDPLSQVMGAMNAVTYETFPLGPVTLIGAGAGRQVTGAAVLADLLNIQRMLN